MAMKGDGLFALKWIVCEAPLGEAKWMLQVQSGGGVGLLVKWERGGQLALCACQESWGAGLNYGG